MGLRLGVLGRTYLYYVAPFKHDFLIGWVFCFKGPGRGSGLRGLGVGGLGLRDSGLMQTPNNDQYSFLGPSLSIQAYFVYVCRKITTYRYPPRPYSHE